VAGAMNRNREERLSIMAARVTTAVGVFSNYNRAEDAVEALRQAGFRRDQINLIVRDRKKARRRAKTDVPETHMEEGALTGAITGGIAGSLLGVLATVALPGVGIFLVTPVAAALLGGAATGAATGGLLGGLIGLGIPEEEARVFAHQLRAGHIIITVRSRRPDSALAILRLHNAVETHTTATVPVTATLQ